jgi:hypothetical protein
MLLYYQGVKSKERYEIAMTYLQKLFRERILIIYHLSLQDKKQRGY